MRFSGAKWTAAPKPIMSDELYEPEDKFTIGNGNFVTTEFTPRSSPVLEKISSSNAVKLQITSA